MKKLFLVLLSLCIVFCGCEDLVRNGDRRDGYIDNDRDDKFDLDDKLEDKFDKGDIEDQFERGDIEDDHFEALGKTIESVKKVYGEIAQTEWVDGPVYKFEKSNFWYGFSDYTQESETYIPGGRCNLIILDVSDFVVTREPEIDEGLIASLSDRGLSKGYSEMEGDTYYEITHDEYRITIYEDQYGELSGDSAAYVRFLGE